MMSWHGHISVSLIIIWPCNDIANVYFRKAFFSNCQQGFVYFIFISVQNSKLNEILASVTGSLVIRNSKRNMYFFQDIYLFKDIYTLSRWEFDAFCIKNYFKYIEDDCTVYKYKLGLLFWGCASVHFKILFGVYVWFRKSLFFWKKWEFIHLKLFPSNCSRINIL